MHCIKTFLWQPYNTLLPEMGDDPTIIKDKIDTLNGCRGNYQTRSYGYSLLSPCCIFGALVIISALGLSGILPGATTGWIIAGLGGSVIAANILMGNIKNRLACVSNYTMIGAIILGVGLAGAFGSLSGITVGIAVLTTWLIGNCFGCYFYYANPFAQRFFNEVTSLKLVDKHSEKKRQDLAIKIQMMQLIREMDSPNFSPSSTLEKLRQLQQEISPSSSLSSELEKMILMLEMLQDTYPSSTSDSSSSDSSDDEWDDELSQVMRMITIRDLQKDIDSPSSSDSSDDERWGKLPQELKVRLLMRQLQKDIDSPSSSNSSELEKKKKMLQYLLYMNSGRYPDSSSSDSISSDSSDSDD